MKEQPKFMQSDVDALKLMIDSLHGLLCELKAENTELKSRQSPPPRRGRPPKIPLPTASEEAPAEEIEALKARLEKCLKLEKERAIEISKLVQKNKRLKNRCEQYEAQPPSPAPEIAKELEQLRRESELLKLKAAKHTAAQDKLNRKCQAYKDELKRVGIDPNKLPKKKKIG